MTETSIIIRDIETVAEMRAVEKFQKEAWGVPDLEVVPLTQLIAARAAGGVLLGAFERENLIGFVYGFVGYERGQMAHHSHMLAVKPEFRSSNIGRRLKLMQRERVLAQGINLMSWTFDPMQSLNAYFNFNKLGVLADTYFVNFYGEDAASFLHQTGTDRLWVSWLLTSRRVIKRLDKIALKPEFGEAKPLIELGEDNAPRRYDLDVGLSGERAFIEIPADINELEKENRELAFEWREATRWAFTEAIGAGYLVEDFYRQSRGDKQCGVYFLSRAKGFDDFG